MKITRKCVIGFAAVEALPALFLADTLIAWSRGWAIGPRFDKAAILLAATVALASGLVLSSRRGRLFYEERWAQVLLLIGSVAISSLVGEGMARLIRPKGEWAPFHGHSPGLHRVLHPIPEYIPGVGPECHFTTNSLGVRGPELPGNPSVVKVLCLGGSTTECLYLDDTKTWSRQLMVRLNEAGPPRPFWVGDMGHAGYSSTMHLRFVEGSDLMTRIDDLVILVGVNDLTKSLMRGLTRGEAMAEDDRVPIWYRSRILELTHFRSRVEIGRIVAAEQDSGGTYLPPLRRRRQGAISVDRLPDLDSDLREYAARLRSIVSGCRARGVRPILLTQPVLWSDRPDEHAASLLYLGWTHDGRFYTPARLREGMGLFNDVLIGVCRELGSDWVDLRSMSGREAFFYDDCHLTEAGASEIGRRAAEWFRGHHDLSAKS